MRDAAADALGLIGDRAAVPALIDALYDEDIDVRFAAAEALGLLADARAIVDLIYLLDNADIPLAMMAALALHKIGTPEALAAIQHLQDETGYNFEVPSLSAGAMHSPFDITVASNITTLDNKREGIAKRVRRCRPTTRRIDTPASEPHASHRLQRPNHGDTYRTEADETPRSIPADRLQT